MAPQLQTAADCCSASIFLARYTAADVLKTLLKGRTKPKHCPDVALDSPAMAPQTAAMPALPMSYVVRLSDSRITGSSAAGLKVEIQAQKNEAQACKVCSRNYPFK
jgi:hypothetical protein